MNEELFTPFLNCGWKHPVDGCCSHPNNATPECHQFCCPIKPVVIGGLDWARKPDTTTWWQTCSRCGTGHAIDVPCPQTTVRTATINDKGKAPFGEFVES